MRLFCYHALLVQDIVVTLRDVTARLAANTASVLLESAEVVGHLLSQLLVHLVEKVSHELLCIL